MKAIVHYNGNDYTINLGEPLDISLPLSPEAGHVLAWYLSPLTIEPVRMGDWVGEVKSGASVNFRNIFFNPHGHGTHTETVGHITAEDVSVNQHFREFFCFATLVTIAPEQRGEDFVISLDTLTAALPKVSEAVILRTMPNGNDKTGKNYSNTNPAYLEAEAAAWLREMGVRHLLIDLPSVDREQDGGALAAHHAFWNHPQQTRYDATITELVYIPDSITDGLYFMNLQTAPFENDASPSRPLLFRLQKPA
ncbi:MAG: cyclase family protein [Bacteroidia bacterium]